MQIVIDVTDAKADFVIELLNSLPFVAIRSRSEEMVSHKTGKLSPKTNQLLGLFPELIDTYTSVKQQAILTKHG